MISRISTVQITWQFSTQLNFLAPKKRGEPCMSLCDQKLFIKKVHCLVRTLKSLNKWDPFQMHFQIFFTLIKKKKKSLAFHTHFNTFSQGFLHFCKVAFRSIFCLSLIDHKEKYLYRFIGLKIILLFSLFSK